MVEHAKKKINKKLGATLHRDGVDFRVWAPFDKAVSVLVNDSFNQSETPMTNEGGYWSATVEDAKVGQSYKYHICKADDTWVDRNDPYARQLTNSDTGMSVIVDPHIEWGDVEQPTTPLEKQVIYELHIGTFHRPDASTEGTFASAIEKLDYLQKLGITAIELMPVNSMPTGISWGYNPIHWFAVETAYGGRRGLLDFVKACHERGIRVILDVVYNHASNSELWQFDGWSENGGGGIYFYNDDRGNTPWGSRFDYGRTEVRQFLLDNIAMWLTEYKIDGLRFDSTTYMRNREGPSENPATEISEAWSLFQEMTKLARKINPHAIMIAEDSSGNEWITKPVEIGGAGFDAQWGISFPEAIRHELGLNSNNMSISTELEKYYNGYAFGKVVFGDSHDTAANYGAVRINAAATPGNSGSVFARQYGLVANAITLTAPGIPMILQGNEFMQPGNFNDWKQLEWDKTEQFAGIVEAHQHLIDLRLNKHGNTAGLLGNAVNVFHYDGVNKITAYHRWQNGGPKDDTVVIVNFNDQRFDAYDIWLPVKGTWQVRFNSSWKGYSPDFNESKVESVTTDDNGKVTIALADYNVLILSQD
jgi:1,4-alpha-glucan branching enzyme